MVTQSISIIIAAHQPLLLCGLMTLLRTDEGLNVLASCRDGMTCLQAIRDLSPDVAIIDCSLPNRGTSHVLAAVRSGELHTRPVVLSGAEDPSGTANLVKEGAYSVLSKEAPPDALVRCLRDVPGGQRALPIAGSANGGKRDARDLEGVQSSALTERERQIMNLVCEGLSNKDIGRLFELSDGTVKVHLHHIYEKLAIHNRTALAVLAAGNAHGRGVNGEASDLKRTR